MTPPSVPGRPSAGPPAGVPRRMWPPPGAVVVERRVREVYDGEGTPPTYSGGDGPVLEVEHLRALRWLLDEHSHDPLAPGVASDVEVVVGIATTALGGGRVGTTYAIDGGALGAPSAGLARGVLWRYLHARLDGAAPPPRTP